MAGMLDACMVVTTDRGVTGDSSRTTREKYTARNRSPGREDALSNFLIFSSFKWKSCCFENSRHVGASSAGSGECAFSPTSGGSPPVVLNEEADDDGLQHEEQSLAPGTEDIFKCYSVC